MVVTLFAASPAYLFGAEAAAPAAPASSGTTADTKALERLGFGLGIGVSFLDESDILETTVANGVIRVTDSEKVKRDAWLETHYTFDNISEWMGWNYLAPGIFVGVQVAGSGGTFDGISAGLLMSWKRTPIGDSKSKQAFNIGAGWVNRKIRVLGDGMVENEPLPAGEEAVRYRKKDSSGWMLMFSFTVF